MSGAIRDGAGWTSSIPVFSVTAWLTLTPLLVTAYAGADHARDARELALGLAIALVVHGALLIAFLVLGQAERALRAMPWLRWTLVGAALLGIAAGRPALLSWLQSLLGMDLVTTPELLRVLLNLFLLAIWLLLVWSVREAMARGRAVERDLAIALEALHETRTRSAATRRLVATAFQRELATEVLDALGGLIHRRLPPEQLAKELRWIARNIVQHSARSARDARLDEAIATTGSTPVGDRARSGGRHDRLTDLEAAPPTLLTAAIGLLVLPAVLSAHGPLLGPLLLLVAATGAWLLAALIRRMPLPAAPRLALAALAGMYAAVGVACGWLVIAPMPADPILGFYLAYGAAAYTAIAIGIALTASGLRRIRRGQDHLAATIASSEHDRFEAQRALLLDAAGTSTLLEQDVQGEILATSFRLETGEADAGALDELIDRVALALRGEGDPTPRFAEAIRDGLRSTLAAWGRILTIRSDVDGDALDWLAHHPGSAGIAHQALTEGLTNAVRLSRDRVASIRLQLVDDAVELSIRTPGRLAAHDPAMIGVHAVQQRAAAELREVDDEVELLVRIDARHLAEPPAASQAAQWSGDGGPDRIAP